MRYVLLASAFLAFSLTNAVVPSGLSAQTTAAPSLSELDVLSKLDPRFLRQVAGSVHVGPDGAVGANRAAFSQVGVQNQSAYIVPDALISHNAHEIDDALAVLEYGFAHMNPDGSFAYADQGSFGAPPTALTQAASAAFLMYDAGRSLCLLSQSPWFATDPSLVGERHRVEALEGKVGTALTWLEGAAGTLRTDRLAVNRIVDYSLAFYLNGKILKRPEALAIGRGFVETALSRQLPDGSFPESGGFDSSYQAVSLFHSQVLDLQMVPADGALRDRLWGAIVRAAARENAAVGPDGSVSTEGNTRVGNAGESVYGRRKTVDTRSVSLALMYFAFSAGGADEQRNAVAVAKRYSLLPQ